MGRCATRTSGLTARKLTHVVAGACWDAVSRPGLNHGVALAMCQADFDADPKHFDRSAPTRRAGSCVVAASLWRQLRFGGDRPSGGWAPLCSMVDAAKGVSHHR